jgi:hypothetical protein
MITLLRDKVTCMFNDRCTMESYYGCQRYGAFVLYKRR